MNTVLSLGFAECVLSSNNALCALTLNAYWNFELIWRGSCTPVYRRLDISQTSGSSVTCFQPVTTRHHISTEGSRLGKKLLKGLDRRLLCTSLPSVFESMLVSSKICHQWTVCFLKEGSRRFHYVACAWTWWHVKKKQTKKIPKKSFKKKVFFLLFFSFLWRSVRFSWSLSCRVFLHPPIWVMS